MLKGYTGREGIEPSSLVLETTALPLSYQPMVGLRLTENRTSPLLACVSVLARQAHWVRYICSLPRLPVRLMKPLGHIRKCSIRQLASLRLRVPHFGDGLPPGCFECLSFMLSPVSDPRKRYSMMGHLTATHRPSSSSWSHGIFASAFDGHRCTIAVGKDLHLTWMIF